MKTHRTDGSKEARLIFGRVRIGEGHRCAVIAEAACEHKGSLREAKRLALAAKKAGADIVKFQLHLPQVEMVPDSVHFWAGSMDEVLAQVNLPVAAHRKLIQYCRRIGIEYLCTAFCPAGIDVLDGLGVRAFKLGSGELTNLPMIRKVARISAQRGAPVLVSTGMSTLEEIAETVSVLREERARFALLNCTSAYPPDYSTINLNLIPRLRDLFGVPVGHSDHTPDAVTAYAAVAVGAKIVEKHFTLSRDRKGPDHMVSLEPDEFRAMVEGIRRVEAALGWEKQVHAREVPVRGWAHHSVVTSRGVRKGEALTLENLIPKRPGSGIPAKYLDAQRYPKVVLGRRARRDLGKDTILRWSDLL